VRNLLRTSPLAPYSPALARSDGPASFAALARKLALPHTAALALPGPLPVLLTGAGRGWLDAFEADGELIAPLPGETRRLTSLASSVTAVEHAVDALP